MWYSIGVMVELVEKCMCGSVDSSSNSDAFVEMGE